jgi:hypothetical protein
MEVHYRVVDVSPVEVMVIHLGIVLGNPRVVETNPGDVEDPPD